MRTHRVKGLVFVSTIVLGLILTSFFGASAIKMNANTGEEYNQPQLDDLVLLNSTSPIIDGDLDSFEGEWENATVYNTDFGTGNKLVTIRVLANETHLFMGINYVSSIYVPINTTIPVGDEYNNETHTWYAIVFDRNYDKTVGSTTAPDDAVVVNYRVEGAQDAFINGTKVNSLGIDVNVTGFENAIANVTEYEDDFHNHVVTLELAKEIKSGDELGYDIDLQSSESVDFLLLVFENETAIYNYTLLGQAITPWKNIEFVQLHEYFSYVDDFATMDVLIYASESDSSNFANLSSIHNFLSTYGMNVTIIADDTDYELTYNRLSGLELFILLGPHDSLLESEVEAVTLYIASGGSALILADDVGINSRLNELLGNFDMQIYNADLYSKTPLSASHIIDSTDFAQLPYLVGNTAFTERLVDEIYYAGSALNFTGEIGESIYQYQEGDLYPIINMTGEFFIDRNGNGEFNEDDEISLTSAITQAGLELQRGGRLIVSASSDLYNTSYIVKESNRFVFLRQLAWLLKFQNGINFDNFVVESSHVIEGEAINVNITINGDNETALTDVRAWIVVQELKSDRNNVTLTKLTNDFEFNGTITPEGVKANFVDVSIRMHLRGYGYNETELIEVFLEPILGGSIQIDPLATIIFVVSIGLAALGAFAVKKYKVVEVEE